MTICLQQKFCANHKTTRNNFSILVEPLGFKTKKEELRPLFLIGGEREIRTPGGLAPTTVFKTAALNRSAISP